MYFFKKFVFFLVSIGCGMPAFAITTDSLATKKDSVQKGNLLVVPIVGRSPETNWSYGFAGAYIFKTSKRLAHQTRTSTLPFALIHTTRNQTIIGLGGNIFFPGERYVLRLENTFSYFPDKFWGIGNDTYSNQVEAYSYSQVFFNPQLLKKIGKNLFFGAVYETQWIFNVDYIKGGYFDQYKVQGKDGGRTSGLGLAFSYDSRTDAYSPEKGGLFYLSVIKHDNFFGSQFNYWITKLDARKYWKIGQKQVLALQSLGIFTDGDVHVRSMGTLGGNIMMRGFYAGRYRDNHSIAFQGEIRTDLFWRLGAVAFAGVGRVAHKFTDLVDISGFKHTFGVGLRATILKKEKFNIRADYGWGDGSGQLYVLASEAF